jgi:hypothetical protein
MIAEHLAQAERQVAEGQGHAERQCLIVARLQRGGHDTSDAWRLLSRFEELQALHVADRDRLRKLAQAT